MQTERKTKRNIALLLILIFCSVAASGCANDKDNLNHNLEGKDLSELSGSTSTQEEKTDRIYLDESKSNYHTILTQEDIGYKKNNYAQFVYQLWQAFQDEDTGFWVSCLCMDRLAQDGISLQAEDIEALWNKYRSYYEEGAEIQFLYQGCFEGTEYIICYISICKVADAGSANRLYDYASAQEVTFTIFKDKNNRLTFVPYNIKEPLGAQPLF